MLSESDALATRTVCPRYDLNMTPRPPTGDKRPCTCLLFLCSVLSVSRTRN